MQLINFGAGLIHVLSLVVPVDAALFQLYPKFTCFKLMVLSLSLKNVRDNSELGSWVVNQITSQHFLLKVFNILK